jgi:hypothetical protein
MKVKLLTVYILVPDGDVWSVSFFEHYCSFWNSFLLFQIEYEGESDEGGYVSVPARIGSAAVLPVTSSIADLQLWINKENKNRKFICSSNSIWSSCVPILVLKSGHIGI